MRKKRKSKIAKKSVKQNSNLIEFPNKKVAPSSRKMGNSNEVRKNPRMFIALIIIIIVLILIVVAYRYVIESYKVTTVYVDGNVHYTSEEIMNIVMEGRYGDNSLILSLKYKDKSIEGIPFIEKMDVTILAKDTIRINVYEKALAGYVEYLEHYLYFDKDGIVVESSQVKTSEIPQVTGLQFNYAVLYEKLPVENVGVFTKILSLSKLLAKYNVRVDKIYFGNDDEILLYYNKVKIALGKADDIDEKIMKLQDILPELEEKSGTLRMENYTEATKKTVFEPDSQK